MRYLSLMPIKSKLFVAFLFILFSFTTALADELSGQGLFVERCVGCHVIKPPVENESIAIELKKKAPSLRYAGSKFQKAFLISWLQNPQPIRPLVYNSLTEFNRPTHLKLSEAFARDVAAYLMTLRSEDVVPLKIGAKDNLLGRKLYSVRYSCYACHRTKRANGAKGEKGLSGGLSGPSLVGAGTRLNPDWIYAFLNSPRDLLPRGSMPVYAGIMSEEDLKELTKYIATFK